MRNGTPPRPDALLAKEHRPGESSLIHSAMPAAAAAPAAAGRAPPATQIEQALGHRSAGAQRPARATHARRSTRSHVGIAHARVDRQAHHALVGALAVRELRRRQAVAIAPVGLQVQRDVVHAAADAGGEQPLDEAHRGAIAASSARRSDVQMPGVQRRRPARRGGSDQRQAGEAPRRSAPRSAARRRWKARARFSWCMPERRGDVGQVVLEARRDDLVVPARHLRR